MPTITYDYIPDSEVFVITPVNGVKKAKVIQVLIGAVMTSTTIKYKCVIEGGGTQDFVPSDVFADIDLALADYKLRIV